MCWILGCDSVETEVDMALPSWHLQSYSEESQAISNAHNYSTMYKCFDVERMGSQRRRAGNVEEVGSWEAEACMTSPCLH
jgi:hypothetical protein